MRVNFDGQMLNGTQYMSPMATLVNQAFGIYLLDTSNVSGTGVSSAYVIQGVTRDLSAIVSSYNEFKYRSVRFDWVPFVAPGVADGSSQIYIAYIDNAELIANSTAASTTVANSFNLAKNARNSKFFNAWERFSFTVPLTSRRKTFDTNTNASLGAAAVDIIDRSVQGAVISGAFSTATAAVSLGQWRVTYEVELYELNANITT